MKKAFFLFLLITTSCFAQEGDSSIKKDPIIDFPDVEAEFTGGAVALQRFIAENVVYPEEALENDEHGRVYISFVVEPDGEITNIVIERGASKLIDAEAKRIAEIMPAWVPGEIKGVKVRTRCRLPIVFAI